MLSLKEIRDRATQAVRSRYWVSVGLLGIITLIITLWQSSPLPYKIIAYIAIVLVGSVLMLGYNNIGMSLARGSKPDLYTAFFPFARYGHNLGGSMWCFLFLFLWLLAGMLISLIGILIFALTQLAGMMFTASANSYSAVDYSMQQSNFTNLSIVPLIIMAVCVGAVIIFKMLQYFCARYLLLDCPKVRATNILNLSKTMMKGCKAKLFVLYIQVFWQYYLLMLLPGVLTEIFKNCGALGVNILMSSAFDTVSIVLYIAAIAVAVLYCYPYSQAAFGIFYFEVKAKALAEGKITYADLGEIPPIAPNEQPYIELK